MTASALETESARRDEQYVQILDKLDEMSSKSHQHQPGE